MIEEENPCGHPHNMSQSTDIQWNLQIKGHIWTRHYDICKKVVLSLEAMKK